MRHQLQAKTTIKSPPRVIRRGAWYARKETRRGGESDTTRPKSAPRRIVFALCHSIQDDYQSSCGSTTVGIIAFLGALCTEIDHFPAAAPFGTPATMPYIRNCAGKITQLEEVFYSPYADSTAAIIRSRRCFNWRSAFTVRPCAAATSCAGRPSST